MGGATTRFFRNSTAVHHYGPATYAEAIVVSERAAVKIPDDVPLETAALVGCAVTAGFGAVANSAEVHAGESVLVAGCGGVGLSAIQAARALGAAPIIAADPVASRRDAALALGADLAVDAAAGDAVDTVLEASGGGVDASIAAAGAVPAIELALAALGRLGTCVIVGAPATGLTVSFDPIHVLNGERRIVGGKYGSADPHLSFPRIVELYRRGRLPLDRLISARYGIEEVNAAHADLEAGRGMRGLLVFT
jgi:Zn-dependent alcohol dehydrogenase